MKPDANDAAGTDSGSEQPPTQDPPRRPLSPRLRKAAATGGAIGILVMGFVLGRGTSPAAVPATTAGAEQSTEAKPTVWTCSMHPQIRASGPGQCPLCGMDLIPVTKSGDDTGPRELKLSPNAVILAGIEVEPVRRRQVEREVRMVGKVDYDETRLNYITAWVSGRLDRLFVDYTGTSVRPGDHLVEVYSPQLLSAQEELIQALEARDALKDGSQLLRETAEATVKSARAKLRLWGLGSDQVQAIEKTGRATEHITIRAPIGGIVVHKNKNTGDYVKTGERVYTIADLTQVWVKLDAYESDLAWIRYGQTVSFEVESYPGIPFEGRVVFVDPVLSGRTRTVKVRLNVDNKAGRLKPGMFVRAILHSPLQAEGQTLDPSLVGKWICPMHWDEINDSQGPCGQCGMPLVRAESLHQTADPGANVPLAVPATAVLWTGKRSLVYVQKPGDEPVFEGQEIVLGPRAGAYYVVRDGLEEGQLVVTKGSFKIDSALQIEARPSMMLPSEEPAAPPRHEASDAFLRALDPVFGGYLTLQAALAADDAQAAKSAAKALLTATRGVDMGLVKGPGHIAWMRLSKRLRDASEEVGSTNGIDAARVGFAPLSVVVLSLERQFGHREGDLREAFCPMALDNKGASWLQRVEEIQNPFFGASMLRCGEVRETFPARGATPVDEHAGHGGKPADPGEHSDHSTHSEGPTDEPPATDPTEAAPPESPSKPEEKGASLLHQLDGVLAAYFALQQDLAGDKATAATRGPELRRALEGVEAGSIPKIDREEWKRATAPALLADVARLEKATDLKAQRQAFAPLSTRLLAVVTRYGHLPSRSVRRFHCPMAFNNKGGDWLQEGEQTLNPYFGSGMLRCGRQVEVLSAEVQQPETKVWTCRMHPKIRASAPGKCPTCGMKLVPMKGESSEGEGQ